jgi:hypothetical protein
MCRAADRTRSLRYRQYVRIVRISMKLHTYGLLRNSFRPPQQLTYKL